MEIDEEPIPEMNIDSAESVVRTILYRFDGQVTTSNEDELANELDHASGDSGAFRAKLADIRKYGLIEGWGDKQLTPLARRLVKNKKEAVQQIIHNIQLFSDLHDRFGVETLDVTTWDEFISARGVDNLTESEATKARKVYNSLVRQLPEEKDEPFSEEYFDMYYADLGKESKRELCLKSLDQLAKRPIPSIEYYDKILDLFEEDEPSEVEKRLLNILKSMCYASTEDIRDDRLEATVDLAMGFLDSSYPPKVRRNAISILEVMDPREAEEDRLGDLWVATMEFARKGIEEDDDDLLQNARQIFRLLVSDWADDSLLKDMWKDTYDDYDAATDYGEFVGYWHETCQEELGLT